MNYHSRHRFNKSFQFLTHLLILILSFFLIQPSLSQKEVSNCGGIQCFAMNYQGCIICYSMCNQNNNTNQRMFQFQSCKQQICSKYWQQTDKNCQAYSASQLDQSTCIQTCCHGNYDYFNLGKLQQCRLVNQAAISASQNQKIIIIVCVVVSCIILLIIALLCAKYKLCIKLFQHIKAKYNNKPLYNDNGQIDNQIVDYYHRQNYQLPKRSPTKKPLASFLRLGKWHQNKETKQKLEEKCCICLEQNTNCMTNCRHMLHFQCLLMWIKKKLVCPLCNSEDYNPIKLICQICKTRCIYASIGSLTPDLLYRDISCLYCEQQQLKQRKGSTSINESILQLDHQRSPQRDK